MKKWIAPKRNYTGIQFEELRRQVDPQFNRLHDELSDAYYNYWRQGKSKPFQKYDLQATAEESKALFAELHGLIFQVRDVVFHETNKKQAIGKQISEDEYNPVQDLEKDPAKRRVNLAREAIKKCRQRGFEIKLE